MKLIHLSSTERKVSVESSESSATSKTKALMASAKNRWSKPEALTRKQNQIFLSKRRASRSVSRKCRKKAKENGRRQLRKSGFGGNSEKRKRRKQLSKLNKNG